MKRTRIKPMSDKKKLQLKEERLLYAKLLIRSKGRCEQCGGKGDFRGLTKHEIKSRAQGGDPTDENNTILLCGRCHSKVHLIKEV